MELRTIVSVRFVVVASSFRLDTYPYLDALSTTLPESARNEKRPDASDDVTNDLPIMPFTC